MKRLILFMLLAASCNISAAVKLVLLGESSTVDILTAKLPQKDFELFERGRIQQIMREHQLSSYGLSPDKIIKHFPHADLIAIVSQAGKVKKTYPSRITVFNAKNGYKLANTVLPPDPAEAAEKAAGIIAAAHAKTAKNPLLLSIGIIRNAGVSDKLKYRIAEIVFALSEALVNSDKAQMLERNCLGAVLDERKLSGTTYTLKTSSRILDLEFLPGSNAGQIDVVLRLTDPAGKVFFSKKYPDIQSPAGMIGDIGECLKTTPAKISGDNREEAKKYYHEFKSFFTLYGGCTNSLPKNYDSVEPLLYAMLALDPQNPHYRYEKIFYDLCRIHSRRDSKYKLAVLRRYIKDANAFMDEFPDYKYRRYSGGFSSNYPNRINPLQNFEGYFSGDAQAELAALITEIRKIDRRCKNGNSPYYLDDPEKIRTLRDLINYRETLRMSIDILPENDAVRLVRRCYETDIEVIRVTGEFIKKHPELAGNAKKNAYYVYFPYTRGLPDYRAKDAWEEIRKILNRDFDKFKKLYTSTGKPHIISNLNNLQTIRDYLNSDGSKAAFLKVFDAALERANLRKVRPGVMYFPHLREAAVARGLPPRWTFEICRSRPAIYFMEKGRDSGLSGPEYALLLVRGWIAGKVASETILENAASIRKLAYKGICENDTGNLLKSFSNKLYSEKNKRPGTDDILRKLNQAFTIRKIQTPFFYCLDAVKYHGKIYMLNAHPQNSRRLKLTRFDPDSGKIEVLAVPDIDLRKFQSEQLFLGQTNGSTLSVSAGRLLAGGEHMLLLYDIEKGKASLLKDLPGSLIASAAIVNDRIYYLCGGRKSIGGSRVLLSMHSCRLDGSDRKTYFSGNRVDKKNELDKLATGNVSAFIEIDGKLLFVVSGGMGNGKIYSFDPVNEKISLLYKSKDMPAVDLFDHGDFILGQGGQRFGEAFFIMDRQTLKPEWFFTQDIRDKKNKYKYRIPGYYSFRKSVVLADKKYLVSGSRNYWNMFLDLEEPEKSPLILLPGACKLIYLAERKEFVFPVFQGGGLYVVKLREGGG